MGIQKFIVWLGKQDPSKEYNYWDTKDCAIGQYAQSQNINPDLDYEQAKDCLELPRFGNPIEDKFLAIIQDRPWTFGAAYQRAKERF